PDRASVSRGDRFLVPVVPAMAPPRRIHREGFLMAETVRVEHCPFCLAAVLFIHHDHEATYSHQEPSCAPWDRVCYAGGFTRTERETHQDWELRALDGAMGEQR